MNNSAYHCPCDFASHKVNATYIVYKIRKYDSTGMEYYYHFSCGMADNHRGVCFLKDEMRMRVRGAVGDRKSTYMDISNFPTTYYNPCQKDRWNVVCVVYDTTYSKSSLWVNHGKICDFACRLPLKPSTLNLFNRVFHFDDASSFNGYIESVEMFNYYKTILCGLIATGMTYLCESMESRKELTVPLDSWSYDHVDIGSVFGGCFSTAISSLLGYLCEKYNMNGS